MKSYHKNLFYSLKIDGDLLEYKVQNTLLRSCLKFFQINTQITLPINMITRSKSRKAGFGHFIEFSIKEPSHRRNMQYKEKRLRKFWLMRRAPLKNLLPEMIVSKHDPKLTYYENSVIPFPVLSQNSVA